MIMTPLETPDTSVTMETRVILTVPVQEEEEDSFCNVTKILICEIYNKQKQSYKVHLIVS